MSAIIPTPAALASAKLSESGLAQADARRLGIAVLTAAATKKLSPTFLAYPALKIPYTDLRGRTTNFYRIRYLGDLNGFDALRKRPPRYVQPPDTTSEVYVPRFPDVDWVALAADASKAVFITEGELKAACATKLGYPTLGLGGVWSFRSAKRSLALLPMLKNEIAWKTRPVYIVFDSDFATKPDVMRALLALARELAHLGAQPYVVTLPEIADEGKTGLDDFLVARGADAFDELVRDARPLASAAELWALNTEVLYVRDPGIVVVLADGRKLSPRAFKEHAYANRHYVETTVNAKGEEKITRKPLAPAWLEWPSRAECARMTYAPGEPRLVNNAYNHWPGWGVPGPKRGDVSLWHRLLDYMFAGEPEARVWFERWAALPFQKPGTKLYTAVVVWGTGQGTGKSLIGYTLGRIYGRNYSEITDQDLASSFNEWAEAKQFVMGDDVTGSEYKKALADRLKSMITREWLRVNAKHLPTYVIPDCVNYYFTSQHPDAFILDDFDRRYFVHEAPQTPLDRPFYDKYDAWYRSEEGASALLDYFMRLPLGGFNPREKAFETRAKVAMTLDAKSDVGAFIAELREAPDNVLRLGDQALRADLYTSGQLLSLYDATGSKRVTANGITRELKRAGFRLYDGGRVVRTVRGTHRLFVVRNQAKWFAAKPHDVAEHWNENFGGDAWDRTTTADEPGPRRARRPGEKRAAKY